MDPKRLVGSLAVEAPIKRGVGLWCSVFVCFVFLCPSASRASRSQSRFGDCAGSQARAVRVRPICRETDRQLRKSPSPLIRSLAPSRRNASLCERTPSVTTASPRSAPQPPFLERRPSTLAFLPPHVHRHPWEEAGYVPVLRRARQSRPGHFDRGGPLPHHPAQNI